MTIRKILCVTLATLLPCFAVAGGSEPTIYETQVASPSSRAVYNTRGHEVYPSSTGPSAPNTLYNMQGHEIDPSVPRSASQVSLSSSVVSATQAPYAIVVTRTNAETFSDVTPARAYQPSEIPVGIIEEITVPVPFAHPARVGFGQSAYTPIVDLGATGPHKSVSVEWSVGLVQGKGRKP